MRLKRFALLKHSGKYETWPLRSRLIVDGKPSRRKLPGYSICGQFEIADGYLIVTDYDCPYEETTNFLLLDRQLRVLSRCSIGALFSFIPLGGSSLERIEWEDDSHFVATFGEDDAWRFTIRRFHVPFLFPKLKKKRV